MKDLLEKLAKQIEELEGKAATLTEQLESADGKDPEAHEKLVADVKSITEQLSVLEAEKAEKEREAELEQLRADVKSLKSRFDVARKPHPGFEFGGDEDGSRQAAGTPYGEGAEYGFFRDLKSAHSGNRDAWERLESAVTDTEGKAMVEKDPASGGFLVSPQISPELIKRREQAGIMRGLIPSQQVGTNELIFTREDSGLAVAWVAEQAEKPFSDLSFSEFSVGVYTAAGLSKASNQLLADSRFSVDQLIFSDFAKRFVALEEIAIFDGTGEGQPLGIRRTPGVDTIPLKSTKVKDLLDAIVDAITDTYSTYFGGPNAIVMHPGLWGTIVKAREETAPNSYLIGPPNTTFGRDAAAPLPGYGSGALPRGMVFGVPVYTTANVPSDLGDGENETAVFVANWSEGQIFDREGFTTAVSEHVAFTSNQTVFRAEERFGFSAGRYPSAFKVIEGEGLVLS